MIFVRVAWPYQARLGGQILYGRPEKDDFVDSRGYPTVLAVGRDRFGGVMSLWSMAESQRCLVIRF